MHFLYTCICKHAFRLAQSFTHMHAPMHTHTHTGTQAHMHAPPSTLPPHTHTHTNSHPYEEHQLSCIPLHTPHMLFHKNRRKLATFKLYMFPHHQYVKKHFLPFSQTSAAACQSSMGLCHVRMTQNSENCARFSARRDTS